MTHINNITPRAGKSYLRSYMYQCYLLSIGTIYEEPEELIPELFEELAKKVLRPQTSKGHFIIIGTPKDIK